MKNEVKKILDAIGLLQPMKKVREKLSPLAHGPRAKIVDKASQLDIKIRFGNQKIVIAKQNSEIHINLMHEVYLWDMVNFFEYYHSAVYPTMLKNVAVVDYSQPALHKLTRSGVEFVFPSLPESDESTEIYMSALGVREGDVVLDFGAYAGASAYFLSKAVGDSGVVVSFEPDEINFEYLTQNISRHSLKNIRSVNKGVWSKSTTLEFQAEGNMGSSAVSILGRTSNIKRVEVLSLDDAARLAGASHINAIKMDIEGAELEVLKNAGDFLNQHKPRLVIEPHIVEGRMITDEM